MTITQIKDKIIGVGLKGTHQRIAIYETLINLDSHPTADKIFTSVSKRYPSISLGTVYKTLDTFVEKELINRVLTTSDIMRYDVRMEEHHHLYCTNSNELMDYDDEGLSKAIAKHFKKKDIPFFKIHEIEVRIKGEIIERQQKLEF